VLSCRARKLSWRYDIPSWRLWITAVKCSAVHGGGTTPGDGSAAVERSMWQSYCTGG